ncbi:class I SAM-dependent methyltransferase [Herbiconiux sp. KACC 21604]|uniref:O-methyltransferase n=1 Tax=unclassified Herbiconiux TaxID=2618217 RepID=UPI0014927B70|nr:class I SAM-dependent methyltransferase [Herbiconiux sp. SALV-R1]QJU53929.1 methyltransferase domain-containing protein [Herbiconiux sp. SALV-R1]WPO84953.1 class I SAM-dependent methyltransferase [Herbiconiux sp. KACC 21604]
MSSKESSWKYADDLVAETPQIVAARAHAAEVGVESVSPAIGSQLGVIAAATAAKSIVEIGTGLGVSALWMLRGAPEATITSIDTELEHQQVARAALLDAKVPANRIRLITGRAADVLPRLNENSYDLVLVDADAASVIEYVEHALRLVRRGGTVLVPHALWKDKVADPVQRGETVTDFRTLIAELAASEAVLTTLSPAGDGLLQVTKIVG